MINERIDLWEGLEYKGEMNDGFRPAMTTFIRSGEKQRGIVVIFPGGGYGFTSPREAESIAIAFNNAGYHAVFVDYSVAPRRYPQALMDSARALTIVKSKVDEWQVDLEEIYVCGFSAGGHLCANISNAYTEKWLSEVEGINLVDIKLKGSILAYPVITYGAHMHEGSFDNLLGEGLDTDVYNKLSMERCVNKNTPETFLWHTVEDQSVPVENTLLYVGALRKLDIPFELHIYPDGGHGLSLATEEVADDPMGVIPHVASWMKLCIEWMAR